MIEQIKVAKNSNVNAVAGSIANAMREQDFLDIQVVGAGALNQAIKGIAIARGYLVPSGIEIVLFPSFKEILINGQVKTAIKLHIKKSNKK